MKTIDEVIDFTQVLGKKIEKFCDTPAELLLVSSLIQAAIYEKIRQD